MNKKKVIKYLLIADGIALSFLLPWDLPIIGAMIGGSKAIVAMSGVEVLGMSKLTWLFLGSGYFASQVLPLTNKEKEGEKK